MVKKSFNERLGYIKECAMVIFTNNMNSFVPTLELHRRLEVTAQQFRKVVNSLRIDGQPIIAKSNSGYKLTSDEYEVNMMRLSLMLRAEQIIKAAEGLNKYIENKVKLNG